MFRFFAIVNLLCFAHLFIAIALSGFKQVEFLLLDILFFINFLVFIKFSSTENRAKRNEKDINEIKEKLGILNTTTKK